MPIIDQNAIRASANNYLQRADRKQTISTVLHYLAHPEEIHNRVNLGLLGIEMLYLLVKFGYGQLNMHEAKVIAMEILIAHASTYDNVEEILYAISENGYKINVYETLVALLSILDNTEVYPGNSWVNSPHIAFIAKILFEIAANYEDKEILEQFDKLTAVQHAKLLALFMTYNKNLIHTPIIPDENLLDVSSLPSLEILLTSKKRKQEYVQTVISQSLVFLVDHNAHAELARLYLIQRWLATRERFSISPVVLKSVLQQTKYSLLEELLISRENQEAIRNLMSDIISQYDVLVKSDSWIKFWYKSPNVKAEFSKVINQNANYLALKSAWEEAHPHLQLIENTVANFQSTGTWYLMQFKGKINQLFGRGYCNYSIKILLQKISENFSGLQTMLRSILKLDKTMNADQKGYLLDFCKYLEKVVRHMDKIDFIHVQPNFMSDNLADIAEIVLGTNSNEIPLLEIPSDDAESGMISHI